MEFTSLSFIAFVALVVVLYYTLFRRCQWFLLLLASIAFYLCAGSKYIVYILITAVTTYLFALRIQALHNKEKKQLEQTTLKKEQKKRLKKVFKWKRKVWLILNLLLNIGILAVIKYANFVSVSITPILEKDGVNWNKTFDFVLEFS